MTGHLVLSTLHTNSAIGAVSRLVDMGVERFLLAPMLRGLVAQRLVRRLCPDCRVPHTVNGAEARLAGLERGARVWRPGGCPACHETGFRGRVPLYEVVAFDRGLERLVHDGASEAALTHAARDRGPGLASDGLAKVAEGLTTVEDVLRAARDVAPAEAL